MTPEELKAIEDRAGAATPGPWYRHRHESDDIRVFTYSRHEWQSEDDGCILTVWDNDGGSTNGAGCNEDADFIASARTDIPALCAALRKAWSEIAQMKDDARHAGIEQDLNT